MDTENIGGGIDEGKSDGDDWDRGGGVEWRVLCD